MPDFYIRAMRMHPHIKALAPRGLLWLSVGAGLATALATLGFAWQFAAVVDGAFLGQRSWLELRTPLAWLALAAALRLVFTWVQGAAGARMAEKVKSGLRAELSRRLGADPLRSSKAAGDADSVGGSVSAWLRGVDALDAWFAQYLPQMYLSVLVPLLFIIVVFPLDWLSALVFLFTVPLIPIFLILVGLQADKKQKVQWSLLLRLGNHFVETLQGLRTLRLLGQATRRARQIRHASESYRLATMRVLRVGFISSLALELVGTLSTAIIAVEIGLRLLYDRVDLHQALFVLLLAPEVYLPMRLLGARYHAAMEGAEAAGDLVKRFSLTEPVKASENPKNTALVPSPNSSPASALDPQVHPIIFSDVEIFWPGATQPALCGLSLHLPPGTTTVLAGPSGAGKSTLAAVLMGLLPLNKGALHCGDVDLTNISAQGEQNRAWAKSLAWVPQRPTLFHGSLRENISWARPQSTFEEVQDAARSAGIHDWILSLPEGYATQVREKGSRLSGGQRQRIALARAFLMQASVLILDEPTSQLDGDHAAHLASSFAQWGQGRTVLHIAHRRSTLESAERVAFMREGRVEAVGSHRELFESCPAYARMLGEV